MTIFYSTQFGECAPSESIKDGALMTSRIFGHRFFTIEPSIDLFSETEILSGDNSDAKLYIFLIVDKIYNLRSPILKVKSIDLEKSIFTIEEGNTQLALHCVRSLTNTVNYALNRWSIELVQLQPRSLKLLHDKLLNDVKSSIRKHVITESLIYPGCDLKALMRKRSEAALEDFYQRGVVSLFTPVLLSETTIESITLFEKYENEFGIFAKNTCMIID